MKDPLSFNEDERPPISTPTPYVPARDKVPTWVLLSGATMYVVLGVFSYLLGGSMVSSGDGGLLA
jgi:hypothetical protein